MQSRVSLSLLAAALSSLLVATPAALADEIQLSNGSRIVGKVVDARDGQIQVETDFAGTLMVALDSVVSVKTDDPVVMKLADDKVVQGQPLVIEQQAVVLGAGNSVALEQLAIVNPEPWELGQEYKWSGLASFAFAIERGNSKTDELDYKLDTRWRSLEDRYTLRLDGEIDEANDTRNADNWSAQGKYDNFITDQSYWGAQILAESDEFADLDLRYYAGPYIGKEFFSDPAFMLSAEVGAVWVNQDYIVAPDTDYPASTWALNISSNYLGGDSRLYIDQIGVWNLDETSDVIVNTTFGLGFPLLFGFEAAAEIKLDYDSGAVEGVEELDETYNLRLGYAW